MEDDLVLLFLHGGRNLDVIDQLDGGLVFKDGGGMMLQQIHLSFSGVHT